MGALAYMEYGEVKRFAEVYKLQDLFDRQHAPSFGACKLAIVASQDAAFGMSRMYQQFADPIRSNVGVFKTYAEALVWLGLDPAGA